MMAFALFMSELLLVSILALWDLFKVGQAVRRSLYGEVDDLSDGLIDLIQVTSKFPARSSSIDAS